MSALGRPVKTTRTRWIWILASIAALPVLAVAFVSCEESLVPALKAVSDCPAAVGLLGKDVGRSYVGLTWGSSTTTSGFGQAQWRTPVKGDRETGILRYVAEKHAGVWQILRAQVTSGDRMVSVVPCESGGTGTSRPGDAR